MLSAAFVLWRRRQRTIRCLLVMPMAVVLAVAAGSNSIRTAARGRVMQYIAPAVCLMAGLGLSTLLDVFPAGCGDPSAALILAAVGIVAMADEFRHPYRAIYDQQARDFARRFWSELAQGGEFACLEWDFGVSIPNAAPARTAIYLCNQQIYSRGSNEVADHAGPLSRRNDRSVAWHSMMHL